jgi:ABC-type sugar transport system ATPase subunit
MGGLRIPAPARHPRGPGFLGIRQEDVTLDGKVAARVTVIEPLSREMMVTLRLGEVDVKVLADQTARPALGAELRLGVLRECTHLFDEAGARVPIRSVAPPRRCSGSRSRG